jgi:hypothetical protein
VKKRLSGMIALFIVLALGSGCQYSAEQAAELPRTQLELRNIQTRVYENVARETLLRSVLATLQDLDYVIVHADSALGSISGVKQDREKTQITVAVRQQPVSKLVVRANVRSHRAAVLEAEAYQRFFTVLDKAIFLEREAVD